jgi:hypothetical protein
MKPIKYTSAWKKYGLSVGGTWGVWLIFTAMIYFLVLGPQNILMARLQKEFVSSNENYNLAQTAGRPETRANMEQKLQDISRKAAYFVVPPEKSSELILQISQLAAKQQLQDFTSRTVSVPSVANKNDNATIADTWLELQFAGSFPQIASFINSLERNDPVIFIENMSLHRGTQAATLPTATVQISYFTEIPQMTKTESTPKSKAESTINKESGK